MITVKYGKGKGKSYGTGIGLKVMEIEKWMLNKTLKQLVNKVAKQFKLKDGDIDLHYINFQSYRRTDG